MSKPTARVLGLLEILQSGRLCTVGALADRLGVDERTVRRDVAHLADLDIPVESVRGRHGGYRLLPGYRLPPLMLTDAEAVAVAVALTVNSHAGRTAAFGVAAETARAKIQRVLPVGLARSLEAVLGVLSFTTEPADAPVPAIEVLVTVAEAVFHRRPIAVTYVDRNEQKSERTFHPYGVVLHSRRWYLPGRDAGISESRTLRLDRIVTAAPLTGTFRPPADVDPARQVLTSLATAPYRYEVQLQVRGTISEVRVQFPAGVATIDRAAGTGIAAAADGWLRVVIHVERLEWIPPALAALDRPFVIDGPDELRTLMAAFADRLATSIRRLCPPLDVDRCPAGQ